MKDIMLKNIYKRYLENSKLLNSVFLNLFIKSSALVLGILSNRWLVSFLPEADLNSYYVIVAYTTFILQSLNLGVYILIQKFYTNKEYQNDLPDIWATFNIFKFFTYFIGTIVILSTYNLFLSAGNQRLYFILIIFTSQFLLEIDSHYKAVCDSRNRAWQFSFTDFVSKIIFLVILYSIGFSIKDEFLFRFYIWTFFSISFISLITDYFWQKKDTKWGKFKFSILKENFPSIIFLILTNLCIALYDNTDRLFLEYFNSSKEVIIGYSNTYVNIFEKAKIIVSMTIPMMASFAKQQLDKKLKSETDSDAPENKQKLFKKTFFERHKTILKIFSFVLIIAVATFFAILVFGPIILRLIDSKQRYDLSFKVLPLLALSIVPYFIYAYFFVLINFKNGEKWMFVTELLTLILAMIVYYFLIGNFSLYGAAIATFIIYCFKMTLNILLYFYLYRD
jgi:O-antigen/teichoic acid export membrane protein